METLLKKALEKYSQAEVYKIKNESTSLHYQNDSLKDIDNEIQTATSLRVIDNGRLGFAYTRNLKDIDELLRNTEISFLGKVKAEFAFPHSPFIEELDSYKPEIEDQGIDILAEECEQIARQIRHHTDAEVEIYMNKDITGLELINSNDSDLKFKSSSYNLLAVLIYPGSGWGIEYKLSDKCYRPYDAEELYGVIERYNRGSVPVKPSGGRMQVLFMPGSLYTLTWRIASGMDSASYYQKISPIADKEGIRIFDEKLTIFDDPLDDEMAGCRSFDDEGVVCRRHVLVENGIFKKRFNDLNYAARLGERPTGHGFRDGLTSQPSPQLNHLRIKTGHESLEEIISGMQRGIILESVLGAHSGNIPNGDFSVGVSPALYVENGKIMGRLKDAMVSGNIYKILRKVESIENRIHPCYKGILPALLIDDVHVDI